MSEPQPLNQIPGLNRALIRARRVEDRLREIAFLPINEEINGVEVRQLTLRHLTILFSIRSPFLFGGIRQIEDVGLFLWIVSLHYGNADLRPEFMAQLVQHPRWQLFYRGVDRYLERALMDKPAAGSGGMRIPASFAAGVIDKISAAYHWDDEKILNMPMARLYQYMRWIDARDNPRKPQSSPFCDRITQRFCDRY